MQLHHLLDLVPPRHRLEPLGPGTALLPTVLLLTLLVAPPSRTLNRTALPAFACLCLYTSLVYTTGSAADDYGRASFNLTLVLRAFDIFVLARPSFPIVFRRSPNAPVPPSGSLARLGWAVKLAASLRGAGWVWQVIPGAIGQVELSRSRFLWHRVRKFALLYLALDVVSSYMQSQPYFHRRVPLAALSTFEHLVNMLAASASAALAINTLYQVVCIACVASQAWEPNECIDLFGSWTESSSLGGFWGRTWHQSFRRPFTSIATSLVRLLRCNPASPFARFLSVFFTFAQSAVLHAFSAFVMNRTGTGALKFFLIQPFGFLLEMIANKVIGSKVATATKTRFGYVWTAGWLLYWSPWFFDELVQAGFWEINPAPLSVVQGISKGQWFVR
ncbi:wax synthase family protein [Sporobolomyces koalae]|uniref:wax synthase family protein n=1 Tax=Sporobolomyces koalae TaxID=500713 RepID=UPI0031706290